MATSIRRSRVQPAHPPAATARSSKRSTRARSRGAFRAVTVEIAVVNGQVSVTVGKGEEGLAGEVWLWAVASTVPVSIRRGENKGRTVTYAMRCAAGSSSATFCRSPRPSPPRRSRDGRLRSRSLGQSGQPASERSTAQGSPASIGSFAPPGPSGFFGRPPSRPPPPRQRTRPRARAAIRGQERLGQKKPAWPA